MDRTKRILSILSGSFAALLIVCLILSIVSVVMLSRSSKTAEEDTKRIEAGIRELSQRVERMEELQEQTHTDSPVLSPEDEAIETVAKAETYYIREVDGKIGIFTKDGKCLKKTDFNTTLLPNAEQKALSEGIPISSLHDLLSLIQDYGI